MRTDFDFGKFCVNPCLGSGKVKFTYEITFERKLDSVAASSI